MVVPHVKFSRVDLMDIWSKDMYLLRVWLLKLRIYFLGLRFFNAGSPPTAEPFKIVHIPMASYGEVTVRFYKKEHSELRYKYGKFRHEDFLACILTAEMKGQFYEKVMEYNGTHFTFLLGGFFYKDEDAVCRILLGTYLDYLNEVM